MIFEVVLDSGETANKCTIAPLVGRNDFMIYPVKGAASMGPLRSTVLLHHEGESILNLANDLASITGIAAIDCVWKRLDPILKKIEQPLPRLVKIPTGFITAYPRQSKKEYDPKSGLATIEAIFVASALLGNPDLSLLSQYYFGKNFLEINQINFEKFKVKTTDFHKLKYSGLDQPRNSKTRKLMRGKISI